jgi:hypothetical protein
LVGEAVLVVVEVSAGEAAASAVVEPPGDGDES